MRKIQFIEKIVAETLDCLQTDFGVYCPYVGEAHFDELVDRVYQKIKEWENTWI